MNKQETVKLTESVVNTIQQGNRVQPIDDIDMIKFFDNYIELYSFKENGRRVGVYVRKSNK